MTDPSIAVVAELAQQVWANRKVTVDTRAGVDIVDGSGGLLLGIAQHPHALEAAALALRVLLVRSNLDAAYRMRAEEEVLRRSSFCGSEVISEPGAAIKVTALKLTDEAQQALSTGGARVPAAEEELPEWVEELAREWERLAASIGTEGEYAEGAQGALSRCMASLRARAKGAAR